jgi:hypothetical protein
VSEPVRKTDGLLFRYRSGVIDVAPSNGESCSVRAFFMNWPYMAADNAARRFTMQNVGLEGRCRLVGDRYREGCDHDVDIQLKAGKDALRQPRWEFTLRNEEKQTVYVTIAATKHPVEGDPFKCDSDLFNDVGDRNRRIEPGEKLLVFAAAERNGIHPGAVFRLDIKNCQGVKIAEEHGKFPESSAC